MKHPVLRVTTKDEKAAMLRVAHAHGYEWNKTLESSLGSLTEMSAATNEVLNHVALLRPQVGNAYHPYIRWMLFSTLDEYRADKAYVFVNSLGQLAAYLCANKA